MADEIGDVSRKSLSQSITQDLYVEVKNWLVSQDPTGKKLVKYREGIQRSLGSVQIMGMSSPRQLEKIYIALRAAPERRKKEKLHYDKLTRSEEKELLYEIRKIQERRLYITTEQAIESRSIRDQGTGLTIQQVIENIGYSSILEEDKLIYEDERFRGEPDDFEASIEGLDKVESEEDPHRTEHGIDAVRIVDKYNHVVVLGPPGSGKTTFLKYLALAYFGFAPVPIKLKPLIPIYVPLREYTRAETPAPNAGWLSNFAASCASDLSDARFSTQWLTKKFQNGECILLLDGIDEVPTEHVVTILQSIIAFRNKFGHNKIVATCRTAAFKYGLEGFQLCEVDEFDNDDIEAFAMQWFDTAGDANAFHSDVYYKEQSFDLCKTPLLLTMLCIQYEYYRSIPTNRSELYGACIDALMFRWDTYRAIKRPQLSKKLSPDRKKRLLMRLAKDTFDRDIYFFEKKVLIKYLNTELEKYELADLDPELVLEEFETHHGILVERFSDLYSFSHLTFHEYFTALAYSAQNEYNDLFQNTMRDDRYREVFLLSLEHAFEPDNLVLGLAAFVKREYIDENRYSAYFENLVEDVGKANIPLDRRVRKLLAELKVDLSLIGTT